MTRQDFYALTLLSSHFPLVFGNGGRWTEMKGECGSCHTVFEDGMFRGTADVKLWNRDGTPRMFQVEGVGLCDDCDRITTFEYRLYDDMSMVGMKNGKWARWEAKRSWWSAVRKFLRGLM